MTSPAKVMSHPDEDISDVAKKMSHYDVSRIPVVEEGKLVGLVTNKELVKEAPQLLNYIVEKIRVSEDCFDNPDSFGKCNLCGSAEHLNFKNGLFVCGLCSNSLLRNK